MGNLVFGSAERPNNPIDAAEIPVVRDNDVAIGQGARPTERPDEYSAQVASAARHSSRNFEFSGCVHPFSFQELYIMGMNCRMLSCNSCLKVSHMALMSLCSCKRSSFQFT